MGRSIRSVVQASVWCWLVPRVLLTVLSVCLLYSPVIRAGPTASPSQSPNPTTVPTPIALRRPALQVAVVGLRNDQGQVSCNLFTDPRQYPRGTAFKEVRTSIHKGRALCVFTEVPAGKYAIVVYHDENDNGHFDQNAFGMPMEGYGFSNNAAPLFDAPNFTAAAFDYDGRRLYTVVDIRY
jgi:uncharacterized protein (DUF2141 family)